MQGFGAPAQSLAAEVQPVKKGVGGKQAASHKFRIWKRDDGACGVQGAGGDGNSDTATCGGGSSITWRQRNLALFTRVLQLEFKVESPQERQRRT